jgi:hypothetical protein
MSILPRVAGAVAPLAMLVLLGAGEAQAQRGLDRLEGRPRDAADMCLQRADELVRDRERGRGGAEIAQVVRADEDDDKVELEAYLNVYARDNDRREAFLTCTVDFEGENRITDFDEDGLLRSINYYRDRDDNNRDRRRRDSDGDQRENARSACRELFETRATASRTSRIATGTTTTCGSRCGWSGGTAAASTRSASTTATATRPASPSCAGRQ